MRIISLTNFLSKGFEKFVMKWLLSYIAHKIDRNQFGGLKGNSVTHYLVELINFILYNQDLKDPHAVLATLVEFSKAFNRVNHNIVITTLSKMGVPGWLLKIVASFLSERELIVRFKGRTSSRQKMPGGGPQGSILGCFVFLILINYLGQSQPVNIGKHITTSMNKRKPLEKNVSKYIDDFTVAVSINLKNCLEKDLNCTEPRPLNYHSRTEHILPRHNNKMQDELDSLKRYADENEMVINQGKTKVILFNNRKSYDFLPKLMLSNNEYLEVVEEVKLLGLIIRSDLSWQANTDNMCKKAYSRLWVIRRLKQLGAEQEELTDVYRQQILSILEFAVPVWTPGLTQKQIHQIERVQKTALYVILGEHFTTYKVGLKLLKLETLKNRRQSLCTKFTTKVTQHEKFCSWFNERDQSHPFRTSSIPNKYKYIETRTNRFKNSPIPYITNIANSIYS